MNDGRVVPSYFEFVFQRGMRVAVSFAQFRCREESSELMTEKSTLMAAACAVLAGLMFGLIASCTPQAKGVPVKQYLDTLSETTPEAQRAWQEKKEQLAGMSRVTENRIFTEKRGYPEYKIGADDVITIKFMEGAEVKEYVTTVRPDGRISYSFVDDLPVEGLTTNEVDAALTEALKKYIRNPRIEITVREFKSKSALLMGQVNRFDWRERRSGPGRYFLTNRTTLLDLIVMAGGAIMGQEEGNADLKRVELVRQGHVYTINLYDVMFRADALQNIIVDDGDIVTIPELPTFGERVYVLGQVGSQGIYRLKDAHDLLAAISIAGGTTKVAVDSDVKIIRGYSRENPTPIVLSANYDEIVKTGDVVQNIPLEDGDVVYVPRTPIGDVNEFIANTVPLLEYMLYPGDYRDAYFDYSNLRF